MQEAEARRAVIAAMSTAAALDLAVDDAIVLSDSNRIVVRLTPCDIVARVAPMTHHASADREVELVRQLAETDSPVATLDARVEPRVYVRDGFKIAMWTYFEPAQDRVLPPAEYAQALGRLHAGLRQIDLATLNFMDRVAATQEDVASRDVTPDLADADRALLANILRDLRRSIVNQCAPEQLLHGEPHPWNVLTTKSGALFTDFENTVRAAANPQLVIVGAGLDGRAWRMPELEQVAVFEVDHPASQRDKRARTATLGPAMGSLHLVPADLDEDDLDAVLAAAGHDASGPTTWVLEGVLPYLTQDAAAMTVAAMASRSAPGSTLVLTYQLESPRGGTARMLARALFVLMGRGDPMADESRRSSWSPGTVEALVSDAGFLLTDDIGLTALTQELSVPDRHVRASRVAVAVSSGG